MPTCLHACLLLRKHQALEHRPMLLEGYEKATLLPTRFLFLPPAAHSTLVCLRAHHRFLFISLHSSVPQTRHPQTTHVNLLTLLPALTCYWTQPVKPLLQLHFSTPEFLFCKLVVGLNGGPNFPRWLLHHFLKIQP